MNKTNIEPEKIAYGMSNGTDGEATGLTKENFFDEIMRVYPEACKMFCVWVDVYKKVYKWDKLFNAGNKLLDDKAPKFHDLPFSMQTGILFEFFRGAEEEGGWSNIKGCKPTATVVQLIYNIIDRFDALETEILSTKKQLLNEEASKDE